MPEVIGDGSDQFKPGSSFSLLDDELDEAAALIVKVRVTDKAAELFAFPDWLAVIEHVPAATARIEVEETIVQILVEFEVKVTVKLLVDDGDVD